MQGSEEALGEFAADNGCVPLAERELRIPDRGKAFTSTLIMVASVAAAAFSLLPTAIAFAAGVLASMALRTVPLRSIYEAIDWPVIILLGALMPVAAVMETTGTATLIAELMMVHLARVMPFAPSAWSWCLPCWFSAVATTLPQPPALAPIHLGPAPW